MHTFQCNFSLLCIMMYHISAGLSVCFLLLNCFPVLHGRGTIVLGGRGGGFVNMSGEMNSLPGWGNLSFFTQGTAQRHIHKPLVAFYIRSHYTYPQPYLRPWHTAKIIIPHSVERNKGFWAQLPWQSKIKNDWGLHGWDTVLIQMCLLIFAISLTDGKNEQGESPCSILGAGGDIL